MKKLRVYLAGPEVFLPNALEVLGKKVELTKAAGFIPVSPGDMVIPQTETRREKGVAISAFHEKQMRGSDMIIANLTPFRGLSADTGTCFELGFMCALEKPAFAYTNDVRNHYQRHNDFYDGNISLEDNERPRAPDNMSIEDFDMIDNVMMPGGVENRNGVVVVGNAAPDQLLTDLTAFKQVLQIAAERLLAR